MTNETGSMSLTSMIKNSALQSHFKTNIFTRKRLLLVSEPLLHLQCVLNFSLAKGNDIIVL